jgi:hypothetical protein
MKPGKPTSRTIRYAALRTHLLEFHREGMVIGVRTLNALLQGRLHPWNDAQARAEEHRLWRYDQGETGEAIDG